MTRQAIIANETNSKPTSKSQQVDAAMSFAD